MSRAAVSHTRPSAITGDDHPEPLTRTFHETFLLSLQLSGRPVSVEWPWPVGPRNSGQSAAYATSLNARISAAVSRWPARHDV